MPAATTAGDASPKQDAPSHSAASDPPVLKTPEDELLLASQDLDYDQHVRELAFDERSKPKEALEKAKRKRQRRMLGLDESESENEGKPSKKRKRGGDDLEDDFGEEASPPRVVWVLDLGRKPVMKG